MIIPLVVVMELEKNTVRFVFERFPEAEKKYLFTRQVYLCCTGNFK